MKTYKITSTINEVILADDENEALEKFWNIVESSPQQNIGTYLADSLKVDEITE
jgi:hypothetical protein